MGRLGEEGIQALAGGPLASLKAACETWLVSQLSPLGWSLGVARTCGH